MAHGSSLLAFIVAAGALTISCSRGGESTAVPLPPASGNSQGLARSEASATCFLDTVGFVENPVAQKSIRVSAGNVQFRGWAIGHRQCG
jgi:hypothetical protein